MIASTKLPDVSKYVPDLTVQLVTIDLPHNHTGITIQASVVSKIVDGFREIYETEVKNSLISKVCKEVKEKLPLSIDSMLGFKN